MKAMSILRWSVLLIPGLVSGPYASGLTQNLDLQLLPATASTNRLDLTVRAAIFSDSDLTRVSGNSLATIGYDIVDGTPTITGIEFTGGQISIAGSSSADLRLTLGNFLAGTVDIVGSGLSGTLNTPAPPSAVNNGQFDTAEHEVVLNSGVLTASGSLLGFDVDQRYDLQEDYLELVQQGTATLDLQQTGSSGRTNTYDVTMTFPVSATVPIEGDVEITIEATGTIVARDSFSITLPLAGDYNGDDLVNLADYTVWRDTLGASGPGLQADGNFDMVVDQEDYGIWKSSFPESSSGSVTLPATAVPESSTMVLAGLGAIGMIAAGRRWRNVHGTPCISVRLIW